MWWRNHDDTLSHIDTIPGRDGQTDGQSESRVSFAVLTRDADEWIKTYSTEGVKSDVSARSPNLTSASCDLELWPSDPQSWKFHPIAQSTTCANFSKIGSFVIIGRRQHADAEYWYIGWHDKSWTILNAWIYMLRSSRIHRPKVYILKGKRLSGSWESIRQVMRNKLKLHCLRRLRDTESLYPEEVMFDVCKISVRSWCYKYYQQNAVTSTRPKTP